MGGRLLEEEEISSLILYLSLPGGLLAIGERQKIETFDGLQFGQGAERQRRKL